MSHYQCQRQGVNPLRGFKSVPGGGASSFLEGNEALGGPYEVKAKER